MHLIAVCKGALTQTTEMKNFPLQNLIFICQLQTLYTDAGIANKKHKYMKDLR